MQLAIIDDSLEYTTGLKMLLAHYGFDNIISFTSGPEVLDYLTGPPLPDAFLVDNRMPQMAGPVLIKKLRELYPGVRIVGMSSDYWVKDDMLAAGADAFVSKAADPDEWPLAIRGGSS